MPATTRPSKTKAPARPTPARSPASQPGLPPAKAEVLRILQEGHELSPEQVLEVAKVLAASA